MARNRANRHNSASAQRDETPLLRVFTCGSVDDGKSTLIGRLLFETGQIYADQLAALQQDPVKDGRDSDADLALLVDGLNAEREQGITIDVAYRYVSTPTRRFIFADTPGHVQYTRNMATGASKADVAILLIDARHGVVEQTKRHACIISLMGLSRIVVAVNKMDRVDYDQSAFNAIDVAFRDLAKDLDVHDIMTIPISALKGENITTRTAEMPWYKGPSLLSYLEQLDVEKPSLDRPFRMPVQWVNRPNTDFRGYCGTIAAGTISVGDPVKVLPSGQSSTVKEIWLYKDRLDHARSDQAVTLVLDDDIDVSRGDILCSDQHPAKVADQFQAHFIWMGENALFPGRQYIIQTTNAQTVGSVTALKYRIDIRDMSRAAAKSLQLNDIGVVNLSLSRPIAFDAYKDNKKTGAFIVIDRLSGRTVGAGRLNFALRRAHNIVRQDLQVDAALRAEQKGQRPAVLWFTGLSGAGKSTIANLLDQALFERGHHSYILDGDNVRHGLSRDLGFTEADRIENIRRIGEVAYLMSEAGLIVICSFISPYRAERHMVRDRLGDRRFFEIFIDTPLSVAEERDVKGLYKRARAGEIKNFTGIDSDYQPPENPALRIDTTKMSAEEGATAILALLEKSNCLKPAPQPASQTMTAADKDL